MSRDDEIWNKAITKAALVAAGYQSAINSKAMAPFAHDMMICSAVIERDLDIASAIEQLRRK